MVAKIYLNPLVDPHFHKDSYGYREGKSAIDALEVTRQRCWQYDWVLEFDIKGLFDNIDHELLMRAVKKHVKIPWLKLYIERWLKAPFQKPNGRVEERSKGTPQGGVISPVLANLFMHYAFDKWMERTHPDKPFARYADDGVIHCRTLEEAQLHAPGRRSKDGSLQALMKEELLLFLKMESLFFRPQGHPVMYLHGISP